MFADSNAGPLEALLRLSQAQAEMASAIVRGWLTAQVELATLLWPFPAPDDDVVRDEAPDREVQQLLSEALTAAMAEAELQLELDAALAELETAPHVQLVPMVLAYCVRCRSHQPIHETPPTGTATESAVIGGSCGACGALLFRPRWN